LFQAYIDEVLQYSGKGHGFHFAVDLSNPVVFVGALLGAALVFLFSAFAIRAVGQAAQSIIGEVRRQYQSLPRENDMIVFPKDFEPEYGACVDIVTKSALRQMILPGLLVVLSPIAVGLVFRIFINQGNPLISAQAVAGMLMIGTIAGILRHWY
jgi:K(+)-stimulated pyrophosphate-energized sodium pump